MIIARKSRMMAQSTSCEECPSAYSMSRARRETVAAQNVEIKLPAEPLRARFMMVTSPGNAKKNVSLQIDLRYTPQKQFLSETTVWCSSSAYVDV